MKNTPSATYRPKIATAKPVTCSFSGSGGNIAPLPIVTGALGARRVVLVPWTAINLIDFWLANRDTAYKRRLSTGTFVNSL